MRSATGDRASLLWQEEACRAAVAEHDRALQVDPHLMFTDTEISGLTLPERPALAALLQNAAEHPRPFEYVVVAEPIVLGRNLTVVQNFIDLLSHHGVGIYIASLGFGSGTQGFRDLLSLPMQHEEKLIRSHSGKVDRGQRAALLQGQSIGGDCYGYQSHHADRSPAKSSGVRGVKLTILGKEAEVVRLIFRQFADGMSVGEISRRLNSDGVPGPGGTSWKAASVRRILRSPRYRGTMLWSRTRLVTNPDTGRVVTCPKNDNELIRVGAPELQIVDDDLVAKVEARLKNAAKP